MKLKKVRKKRNSLAHGDESFSNCARDLTVSDLENIKDVIFNFLSGIIEKVWRNTVMKSNILCEINSFVV